MILRNMITPSRIHRVRRRVNNMDTHHTIDNIVKNNLTSTQLAEFNRIYYGRLDHDELEVKESSLIAGKKNNFEITAYSFPAAREEVRPPRKLRLGLIQHSIVLRTDNDINEQRQAIFNKIEKIIDVAAAEGIKVLCLQETWPMPFFLCTKEKEKWSEFAESAENGPSTRFLSKLAKKYEMVIVSPILERDDKDGVWWNTAIVIDEKGNFMGKHRKNHLPSVGSFSETSYYAPGNMGHAVFETKYAKIAVNICYGRHQALNWLMFALNGAEVVFNPAATISAFGESFWGIEARAAAVANSYFTCSINRVGTEKFYLGTDKQVSRTYYGSSYVTAPNGCRTPSLSRENDGLMIVAVDLNLCRQVKDQWQFNTTARLDLYAKSLNDNVVREPTK